MGTLMNTKKMSRVVLLTAVAAMPALLSPVPAQAQYRIDTGRAQDANNRLGAYGYNDSSLNIYAPQGNQMVTGNQVITGNVTGGRGFRGFVPYTDPSALRTNTAAGRLDNFVKNSN